MKSMRQLGTALFYALVSVVLVVGGLSLALAEGGINAPHPTAKPSPTLFFSSTPPSAETATAPFAPSSTPQIVYVTATQAFTATQPFPSIAPSTTQQVYVYPTATTRTYYPTPVHCGPYYGWIKSYTVQQGDTLFHISTLYQTTVTALQVANCLSGTFIYPGELLWIPNVATITPGVTMIPTFPTSTSEVPTDTPVPPTDTAIPTFTNTPVTPNP
jgi:LysM repeat protein